MLRLIYEDIFRTITNLKRAIGLDEGLPSNSSDVQKYAYNILKFSANDAMKFNNKFQVKALEIGASVEDALKFNNKFQFKAFKRELSVEDALKFKNPVQVAALKRGLSVEDALKLKYYKQGEAIDSEFLVEDDLLINSHSNLVEDMYVMGESIISSEME